MTQLSEYLEQKFHSNNFVFFILDLNSYLINYTEILDYTQEITISEKSYKIEAFKTDKIDAYNKFFKNKIRYYKKKKKNYLIILSHNLDNDAIPDLDFYKKMSAFLEFDVEDFVQNQFKISLKITQLKEKKYDVNWFINHSPEILAYKAQHQDSHSTSTLHIKTEQIKNFFDFCKKLHMAGDMPKKPLFVVDMTLFEFVHILRFINDVQKDYSNEPYSMELLREKRKVVKTRISDMLGIIPMDFNSGTRNLTKSSTRTKMVGNFMITINQLKLLEDNNRGIALYESYLDNQENFYKELKNILLEEGKWKEYLEAIEKANNNDQLVRVSDYLFFISKFMQNNYYTYYPLRVGRWKKQFNYVLKWMLDSRLHMCKRSKQDFRIINIS